jgi:hypothetical protein
MTTSHSPRVSERRGLPGTLTLAAFTLVAAAALTACQPAVPQAEAAPVARRSRWHASKLRSVSNCRRGWPVRSRR